MHNISLSVCEGHTSQHYLTHQNTLLSSIVNPAGMAAIMLTIIVDSKEVWIVGAWLLTLATSVRLLKLDIWIVSWMLARAKPLAIVCMKDKILFLDLQTCRSFLPCFLLLEVTMKQGTHKAIVQLVSVVLQTSPKASLCLQSWELPDTVLFDRALHRCVVVAESGWKLRECIYVEALLVRNFKLFSFGRNLIEVGLQLQRLSM